MPVLRSTVLIDAPPRTVAGLLRDAVTNERALRRGGHRFTGSSPLLRPGDEVRVGARVVPASGSRSGRGSPPSPSTGWCPCSSAARCRS
ncbi:hypothetical protein BJF78_16675 [Pseudonocardia sp. CNS-139]|nr:hypothetical protein BJF78_16675 [Pseudonocardia sp. CNS-139]